MRWHATWFILVVIAVVAGIANNVHAQERALTVVITRPGEGETLYSSPTAPFANITVTGWVSADDFDVKQLQVRLDVLQEAKLIGSLTTAPLADGAYSFDIAINSNPLSELASPEKGCKGNCHALMPLSLPSGAVFLRVAVMDPLGRMATAERSIIVDQSGYADVSVQVVIADHPGQTVAGLRVVATTRLYDWRAREYSAATDAAGRATLHPEALAQMPTRYLLRVEPRVINGVLYSSPAPLEVIFPPGTTVTDPILLKIASQYGRIEGTIDPKGLNALTVRAIQASSGATYATKTAQGRFSLMGLPIAKYLLAIDEEEAAAQGAQAAPQLIDLTATPVASATLQLVATPTRAVRGIVRDDAGNPLPLAWVAMDEQAKSVRVSASSGEFAWYSLSPDARVLWVTAPGYWRRPIALDADRLDITLSREPETRTIPWGSGTIMLPPETIATLAGNRLTLKRGWVWGKGSGVFSIATPDVEIGLHTGRFALESLPGETSWLYLTEGQAQVTVFADDESIALNAGQMLAFGKGVTHPSPVAFDSTVVQSLRAGETRPVWIETDPALPARLRDELARRGISITQIAIIPAGIIVVIGLWWLRRRWSHHE